MTVTAQLTPEEWLDLQAKREHKPIGRPKPVLRIPKNAMTTKEEIAYLIAHICKQTGIGPQEPVDREPAFVRKPGQGYIFAYGRVSLARQETSMEVQREKLTEWAATQDDPLARVRIEAISGVKFGFFDRPESRKLVREMDKGDTLVVHKLDRLGRSVEDMIKIVKWLNDSGIRLVILDHSNQHVDTTTAIGQFLLNITSSTAQLEAKQIGERTSVACQLRKSRGLVTNGQIRRGYKRVWTPDRTHPRGHRLTYVYDAAEVAICREVYERRLQGESYKDIAEDFYSRKVKTAEGDPFVTLMPDHGKRRWNEGRLSKAYKFYADLVTREQGLAPADPAGPEAAG